MEKKGKVTEKRAMEMLEILPPRIWYKNDQVEVFQVGEPYDHNEEGKPRYDTYYKPNSENQWYYLGHKKCPKVPKKDIIMENRSY